MEPNPDFAIFSDLVPRGHAKKKREKAKFQFYAEYGCGSSMNGYGTKRACMDHFGFFVDDAKANDQIARVIVTREVPGTVTTIAEWARS